MLILRIAGIIMILTYTYLKGFKDCMFGRNDQLFDGMRKRHIENGGEDIWEND